MIPEEREVTLAKQTKAGREALAVVRQIRAGLTGEQRLEKAFELTETTRQMMRAGIAAAHPELNEIELQRIYVDRLLHLHGVSLESIRANQKRGE